MDTTQPSGSQAARFQCLAGPSATVPDKVRADMAPGQRRFVPLVEAYGRGGRAVSLAIRVRCASRYERGGRLDIPMDRVVPRFDQVLGRWRCPRRPGVGIELARPDAPPATEPRVRLLERPRPRETRKGESPPDTVRSARLLLASPRSARRRMSSTRRRCCSSAAFKGWPLSRKCALRRETRNRCPSSAHVGPELRRNSGTAPLANSGPVAASGSLTTGPAPGVIGSPWCTNGS